MPSPLAEWHHLLRQAQQNAGYSFSDEIESYLILTLDHYTSNTQLINDILAFEFLENANVSSTKSCSKIRALADHCLILSGLFPENANKKNVPLNYFIGLGQGSYSLLSDAPVQYIQTNSKIFTALSDNFIGLMDILHHMRNLNNQYGSKKIII